MARSTMRAALRRCSKPPAPSSSPASRPAVDTIGALLAAVQAFDATPLGLQVDSDADAAVRESLRRTGLVLLGERHGIAQTPVLVGELIAWFGLGAIALEWHEYLRPWLDRWITHGVLADPVGGDPAVGIWSGDGRLTAGHLAALRRWAAAGLLITLIGFGVMANRVPWLPERLMSRRVSTAHLVRAFEHGSRLVARLERFLHPRLSILTSGAAINRFNGFMIVVAGVLLMAPFGLVPFSNTLPGLAILFLAVGMLQKDGVFVLLGYLFIIATIVYCVVNTASSIARSRRRRTFGDLVTVRTRASSPSTVLMRFDRT
mgnify:CR=1 FL=1